MEKVRQAMELALKEDWKRHDVPVPDPSGSPPEPVAKIVSSEVSATPKNRAEPRPEPRPEPTKIEIGATRTPPDVKRIEVSRATLAHNRLVAGILDSPEREAYCLLQSVVSRRMSEHELSLLGVTSPRGTRGKTLTAVNLAISLAVPGNRSVLLIDLDLENPSVHTCFDLTASTGVENCLFGDVALTDVIFTPAIEGLMVLPSRGGSRHTSQILRSPDLKALLAELKEFYPDCIAVVDFPAVVSSAQAEALGNLVDAMLLVAEDGVTRESDYRRTLGALRKSRIVGTVLNGAQLYS